MPPPPLQNPPPPPLLQNLPPPPPQNPRPSCSSTPSADAASETSAAIAEPHIRVGPCGTPSSPSSRNPRAGHGRVAGSEEQHKAVPDVPYIKENTERHQHKVNMFMSRTSTPVVLPPPPRTFGSCRFCRRLAPVDPSLPCQARASLLCQSRFSSPPAYK
ncbi:rho GTPase-activating protein gacO-like [Triticum aestivum]|uniref:rho GTPase-activating protein gacO-like n=1 Tax=Triticum aestivum TaxID=4565 RepID=UPI001D004299|nr:rho GTPase-activating protein gacO-like [Triticum aestivum]